MGWNTRTREGGIRLKEGNDGRREGRIIISLRDFKNLPTHSIEIQR